ncbi:MAG TPA: hypothetical protein VFI98_10090 [Pseudolabrys sp.]|jgi:hypothetical protein|nr:hypothetical protein [Pseudolabrys sp.]
MEMSSAPDIRRRPHRVTWHPAASDLGKHQEFSRGALLVMVKIFQIIEFQGFLLSPRGLARKLTRITSPDLAGDLIKKSLATWRGFEL